MDEEVIIIKKPKYLNLIPILLIAFVLFKTVYTTNFLDIFLKLISPFIWALAIAYLLNPLMMVMEKKLKLRRLICLIIIYIFLIGLIILFITIITPRIVENIKHINNSFPEYLETAEEWLILQSSNLEFLQKYGVYDYFEENLNSIIDTFGGNISVTLSRTISRLINITSALLNFVLGVVISIYMLKDKEIFIKQIKKLLYAIFSVNKVDYMVSVLKELNTVFSKYLIGKIIDSIIIGILCFFGLLIIGVRYPLVLSSIVGITNMIPYFGPFIGMIPAIIVTLFYSPIKALWVGLFILALQQFDGLYLGPKILGTQVGLKPLWVISAIIIGGGLFGVVGMLLAIPVTGMIKTLLSKYINSKLSNKNVNL